MDNFKIITEYGNTSEIDSLVLKARNQAVEFKEKFKLECESNKKSVTFNGYKPSVQHFENGKSFFTLIICYQTNDAPDFFIV